MDQQPNLPHTNRLALGLIALFILGAILLGAYLYFDPIKNLQPAIKAGGENASVEITSNQVNPVEIKIRKGSSVVWNNKDEQPHQIASDPHPLHTNFSSLNSQIIEPSGTYSFTFTKSGTYTYHDHLNPLVIKGKVIVE